MTQTLFHLHSNGVLVSCCAPSHGLVAALRSAAAAAAAGADSEASPLRIVAWQWASVVAHLAPSSTPAAAHERSKRAQRAMVERETVLATARTSDGRSWPLRAGVRGFAMEVNDRLDDPAAATALLRDAPTTEGWLSFFEAPARMRSAAIADADAVADVAALDAEARAHAAR